MSSLIGIKTAVKRLAFAMMVVLLLLGLIVPHTAGYLVFAEGEASSKTADIGTVEEKEIVESIAKPAFCLFQSGERLSGVGDIVVEIQGTLYLDVRAYASLLGYSEVYYPSGLCLLKNGDHKVLYMKGTGVYREVSSFGAGNPEDRNPTAVKIIFDEQVDEEKDGQSFDGNTGTVEYVHESIEGSKEKTTPESSDSNEEDEEGVSPEGNVEDDVIPEDQILAIDFGEDKNLHYRVYFENNRVYVSLDDAERVFGSLSYSFDKYGVIQLSEQAFNNLALFSDVPRYQTTEAEVKDFARLLYYETRSSSLHKKLAVGGVVMNRVHSSRFPNTITGVIYAHNQFPPAYYPTFSTLEPDPMHYEGAVRSINGENAAPNCLFFNLVPFAGKEADFYQLIEGDYFYY